MPFLRSRGIDEPRAKSNRCAQKPSPINPSKCCHLKLLFPIRQLTSLRQPTLRLLGIPRHRSRAGRTAVQRGTDSPGIQTTQHQNFPVHLVVCHNFQENEVSTKFNLSFPNPNIAYFFTVTHLNLLSWSWILKKDSRGPLAKSWMLKLKKESLA